MAAVEREQLGRSAASGASTHGIEAGVPASKAAACLSSIVSQVMGVLYAMVQASAPASSDVYSAHQHAQQGGALVQVQGAAGHCRVAQAGAGANGLRVQAGKSARGSNRGWDGSDACRQGGGTTELAAGRSSGACAGLGDSRLHVLCGAWRTTGQLNNQGQPASECVSRTCCCFATVCAPWSQRAGTWGHSRTPQRPEPAGEGAADNVRKTKGGGQRANWCVLAGKTRENRLGAPGGCSGGAWAGVCSKQGFQGGQGRVGSDAAVRAAAALTRAQAARP